MRAASVFPSAARVLRTDRKTERRQGKTDQSPCTMAHRKKYY